MSAPIRSIANLRSCAGDHLAAYTDPNSWRAFCTYDRLGDPDTLTPLDCLAPALLSVSINYRQVVPLFQPSGPGAEVLSAMRAVLALANDPELDFLTLDLDDSDGPWAVIDAAVVASGDAGG